MSQPGDVVLWMPFDAPWRPHPDPSGLCCDALRAALECDDGAYETPFDNPNAVLVYNGVFDEFGVILRGTGAQYVLISHCPWCGAPLPASRRDAWFDALEALGFDDPNHQEVPAAFLSDAWRRS
ncbi:MAG: hypothetical protein AAF909_09910 [Pseudomonadota bacterium]